MEFSGGIAMVVMILMTRSRKRKEIVTNIESSFDLQRSRQATSSFRDKPIQVFLDLSFNTNEYITFRTNTELIKIVVKRKFDEFLDIESYLLEYMQYTFPERIQDVPIIDKSQISASTDISSALEMRFKNLDNFLQGLATHKEFWSKEVLEFLGLETEELQTNFLAQHDKYLQLNKRSIITENLNEFEGKTEDIRIGTMQHPLFKQRTPKGQSSQPTQAKMKRRTTFYTEVPKIIENYGFSFDSEDFEPNRKMLRITVLNYKKSLEDIQYTIYIEYFEGKNWTIFKGFAEIVNHRRKVGRLFPELNLPKLSQGSGSDSQVDLERK